MFFEAWNLLLIIVASKNSALFVIIILNHCIKFNFWLIQIKSFRVLSYKSDCSWIGWQLLPDTCIWFDLIFLTTFYCFIIFSKFWQQNKMLDINCGQWQYWTKWLFFYTPTHYCFFFFNNMYLQVHGIKYFNTMYLKV